MPIMSGQNGPFVRHLRVSVVTMDTHPKAEQVSPGAVRLGYPGADAVESAYLAHYRDVYRYAFGLTRSTDDAEEITAEVFERAVRNWTTEPERPLPWLLLTARRIATDRWRRARRYLALVSGARRNHSADNSDQQSTEFTLWFDAVCRLLTARQREALVLRYQRDLSDAEIARILGTSQSGARSLISRAIEVLRSHPEVL